MLSTFVCSECCRQCIRTLLVFGEEEHFCLRVHVLTHTIPGETTQKGARLADPEVSLLIHAFVDSVPSSCFPSPGPALPSKLSTPPSLQHESETVCLFFSNSNKEIGSAWPPFDLVITHQTHREHDHSTPPASVLPNNP